MILWQNLIKSKKLDFAFFAFDAFSFLFISRSFFVCLIWLTYLMNFLQLNYINMKLSMSQKIFENFKIHNDVIKSWCDLHSRQYRITQTQDICFMIYLLFNSRYQMLYRCNISWRSKFKIFSFSIIRSHVLQIDFTSYLKSRTSIRSFLQFSHRCMN